jgi:hypothetical protein
MLRERLPRPGMNGENRAIPVGNDAPRISRDLGVKPLTERQEMQLK